LQIMHAAFVGLLPDAFELGELVIARRHDQLADLAVRHRGPDAVVVQEPLPVDAQARLQ
jgi:hypothetical protein